MNEHRLNGLQGDDPQGFLAALGTLRLVARVDASAALRWDPQGSWTAVLTTSVESPASFVADDAARWHAHPAIKFAEGADRKIQDLKHPPEVYRQQLREAMARFDGDREELDFLAAYATGVAVDGSGQTKPTALHFAAGQQRFMDVVLTNLPLIDEQGVAEAIFGPHVGSKQARSFRWRSGAARERALLSFDPSNTKDHHVASLEWLAFQGLAMLPSAPVHDRIVTTCFTGRGKRFRMTWPLWTDALRTNSVQALVRRGDLAAMKASSRQAIGVAEVRRAEVERSDQGYGSFAPSVPV